MKKNVSSAVLALLMIVVFTTGCSSIQNRVAKMMDDDPYEEQPFYYRYLHPGTSALDAEIVRTYDAVRNDTGSAELHNRLGALLIEKGFPKDAEMEFRRAMWADPKFFPARYNIALARQARGDEAGAMRALRQTLDAKPGHSAAHFQLGLMLEKRGRTDEALDHYVMAYRINESLLDVRVNPLILDSDLVDLALVRLYPDEHAVRALQFEPSPQGYVRPEQTPTVEPEAPSEIAEPEEIVPPAPPITDPPSPPPADPQP